MRKEYQCNQCEMKFADEQLLKMHKVNRHPSSAAAFDEAVGPVKAKDAAKLTTSMAEMAIEATDVLTDFLSTPNPTAIQEKKANVARAALGSWTKHEANMVKREENLIGIASQLAANRDELLKFVKLTIPGTTLALALPEKSEPDLEKAAAIDWTEGG